MSWQQQVAAPHPAVSWQALCLLGPAVSWLARCCEVAPAVQAQARCWQAEQSLAGALVPPPPLQRPHAAEYTGDDCWREGGADTLAPRPAARPRRHVCTSAATSRLLLHTRKSPVAITWIRKPLPHLHRHVQGGLYLSLVFICRCCTLCIASIGFRHTVPAIAAHHTLPQQRHAEQLCSVLAYHCAAACGSQGQACQYLLVVPLALLTIWVSPTADIHGKVGNICTRLTRLPVFQNSYRCTSCIPLAY